MDYMKDNWGEEDAPVEEEEFIWEEDRFPDEENLESVVVPAKEKSDPEDQIMIKMIF